ncbi:uncharacterized protein LOC107004833 [Solanum pennellii]|uniref:Uncharacterized protein LOC107004833 n=1 Tax=Solanum pennellii TaxID=28526 RepID=A0ABM1UYU0_SOLPN|nr:uncharacterized protein LOC107004833 [Solanum pennellii]
MVRLQQEIPEILCKLERIFPPSFFDSMEHLLVHLAYEAMIDGPVQYRWIYPFERFRFSASRSRIDRFPISSSADSVARVHIDNQFIKALAEGPCRSAKQYTGYNVNGFKFQSEGHSLSRSSNNSGVCIKGTNYSADENYFNGVLTEILEMEYKGSTPIKRTVLFKYDWFDPTPNVGMKIHRQYKLVDINHRRKLRKYESFVLAMQASQVYYAIYPSLRRDKNDWWVVCKTKARCIVDMPPSSLVSPPVDVLEPFQCDEDGLKFDVVADSETIIRNDPNGNLRDEDDNLDDETEFHDELESESDDE